MKKRKNLYWFNLSTDSENLVLNFGIDWINEASKYFEKVYVYSTHVGNYKVANNVEVRELGGGTLKTRLVAITRLMKIIYKIIRNHKSSVVFNHMNEKTAAITSPFTKIFKISNSLWYSHSKNSLTLNISRPFISYFFTTYSDSIPFKSLKVQYIGHLIDSSKFYLPNILSVKTNGILFVGRISKIKNIDKLINAIYDSKSKIENVVLAGPCQDISYLRELEKLAIEKGITLDYIGERNSKELLFLYQNFAFVYSGTPASIDKTLIEGSFCGCIPISPNTEVLRSMGISKIGDLEIEKYRTIGNQLEHFKRLNQSELDSFRRELSRASMARHSLSINMNKIISTIRQ